MLYLKSKTMGISTEVNQYWVENRFLLKNIFILQRHNNKHFSSKILVLKTKTKLMYDIGVCRYALVITNFKSCQKNVTLMNRKIRSKCHNLYGFCLNMNVKCLLTKIKHIQECQISS